MAGVIPTLEVKINKTFLVDEIEDFSKEIIELGAQYRLKMLENWGYRLFEDAQSFDLQKITKTLEYFPGLIKGITHLVRG